MKFFIKPLILTFCIGSVSHAQDTTEKTALTPKPAEVKPSVHFMGKTFTLQSATTTKIATTNDYYLPNQKRTSFSHRLTVHYYPNLKGAAKRAQNLVDFFNKSGSPSELETNPPEGVVGVYRTQILKAGIQYDIASYTDRSDGKAIQIQQLSLRISKI